MSYLTIVTEDTVGIDIEKAKEFTDKFCEKLNEILDDENIEFIVYSILEEMSKEKNKPVENAKAKPKLSLKKAKAEVNIPIVQNEDPVQQIEVEPHLLPVRPQPTGFSLFAVQNRDSVKQRMIGVKAKDITAELYKMWNELSGEEKEKFNVKPNEENQKNKMQQKKEKIEKQQTQNLLLLNITKANKMKVDELRQYVKNNAKFFSDRSPNIIEKIDKMKKGDILEIVKA